jgi:hypothetical protein
MMAMRKLGEPDCRSCMETGEFSPSIIGAAPSVAVVMTQSWCPQWARMRSYLEPIGGGEGVAVFWVEYDREPFFEPFMSFKEGTFGNHEVPYVRYYRAGELAAQSNYVERDRFLALLGGRPRP